MGHHLLRVLTFSMALRVRKRLKEVHVYSLLFFIMKYYRQESNREVGMHYAQSLFDMLHKTGWWRDQGTLDKHLVEPNKEVLEKLRVRYPKQIYSFGVPQKLQALDVCILNRLMRFFELLPMIRNCKRFLHFLVLLFALLYHLLDEFHPLAWVKFFSRNSSATILLCILQNVIHFLSATGFLS